MLLGLPHHHGLLVQLVDAARLAEGRADAGGELREVAVDAQQVVGAAVVAVGHGAVLVGDKVSEGASVGVAEGLAAVAAARGLFPYRLCGQQALDFLEVAHALVLVTVDVVYSFHMHSAVGEGESTSRAKGAEWTS